MKNLLAGVVAILSMTFSAVAGEGLTAFEEFKKGKSVIVDVREDDEIKAGMVKGATWFPLSKFAENEKEIIKALKAENATKKVYVYCRSGRRSQTFMNQISNHGIQATNLGGFDDLVKEGLPTVKGP
jgi:rhodanese-related sulfurtransferase